MMRAMTQRVLLAYNASERAEDALVLAARLAGDLEAAIAVGVVVPTSSADGRTPAGQRELAFKAEPILSQATAELSERIAARQVERVAVGATSPAEGIAETARGSGATLVVVGSSHRGPLGRIVPGTTVSRLIPRVSCPVAIAPAGYAERAPESIRIVGLAFDCGPDARRAAKVAVRLAEAASAGFRAFGVVEPALAAPAAMTPMSPEVWGPPFDEAALQRELDDIVATLPEGIGGQTTILCGSPASALVETGTHAVDVLVLGSHAYGRLARLLTPSTSLATARAAPWPVVIVPPGGDGGAAEHEQDWPVSRGLP
jgi:nucleotide-binding universal stress UspA family protein